MKFRGKELEAGMVIHVPRGGEHVPWTVSDWSPATGDIYGRLDGGPYERLSLADPCPPPPPTPEEIRAARAEARAARKAQLEARDECIRQVRERDRRDGIVTISSGSMSSYRSRY